jgi:hypothetical protein
VLKRANELRADRDLPPILARVTPHTLRRTYITFMLAAGFDLPYVQSQVGHVDPTVTLAVYAQVIRRQDRDRPREEMRKLLGERPVESIQPLPTGDSSDPGIERKRQEKAANPSHDLRRCTRPKTKPPR